ncbi:MAG: PGF-pre-PGF domain-containing protein [archaeon]
MNRRIIIGLAFIILAALLSIYVSGIASGLYTAPYPASVNVSNLIKIRAAYTDGENQSLFVCNSSDCSQCNISFNWIDRWYVETAGCLCYNLSYLDGSTGSGKTLSCSYTAQESDSTTGNQYWIQLINASNKSSGIHPADVNFNVNHAPNASGASLNESTAYADSVLTCNATLSDTDNDAIIPKYNFTIGNVELQYGTSKRFNCSAYSHCNKTASVNCTIQPVDSKNFFQPSRFRGAYVAISNSVPSTPSIAVTPPSPDNATNLTCNVTTNSTDADNDPVSYYFIWYNETNKSVSFGPSQSTYSVLMAGNTTDGDRWNCTVTPTDGTANGTSASQKVYVTYETGSPSVNLSSPADLNRTNKAGQSFIFNATDNVDSTLLCRLWGNFTGTWGAATAYGNMTTGIFQRINHTISGGLFKWNIQCRDAANNTGFAPFNFSVSADLTAPPRTSVWPLVNVTTATSLGVVGYVNETNTNITIYANHGSSPPNTAKGFTSVVSVQLGSAKANESVSARSNYVLIDKDEGDSFQPGRFVQFSGHYPVNYTRYIIDKRIEFDSQRYKVNFTTSLTNSISTGETVSVHNSSIPTGWFSLTVSLFAGENNITAAATDSYNNQGPSSIRHTTHSDRTPPATFLHIPGFYAGQPTLQFNISDDYSVNMSSLKLALANGSTVRYYSSSNISCTLGSCSLPLVLADGFYNVTVYINDTVEFSNRSSASFLKDTVSPAIITAETINVTSEDSVDVLFNASDNLRLNLSLIRISPYNSTFHNASSMACSGSITSQRCNITLNLTDGFYNLTITANDTAGHGASATVKLFKDSTKPGINASGIADAYVSNPSISFTATDNLWLNLSTLIASVVNTTRTSYHAYDSNRFNTTGLIFGSNISCSGNLTYAACQVALSLGDGHYNLTFSVTDAAGNLNTTQQNITINTSIAAIDRVYDGYISGGAAVLSDITTTNHLFANWTAVNVPPGVDRYEYAVGTNPVYPGPGWNSSLHWTSAGTNTSVNRTMQLTPGNVYYFHVRALMNNGNYTAVTASNGILYEDLTPPECPGGSGSGGCIADDGIWTSDNQSIHVILNFRETGSTITLYEYAIGTSHYPLAGYDSLIARSNTTLSDLREYITLTNNETYYASARARNSYGIWSSWYYSDNITVDILNPENGSLSYSSINKTSNTTIVYFSSGLDTISRISSAQLYMSKVAINTTTHSCPGFSSYVPYGIQVPSQTQQAVDTQSGYCYKFRYAVTDNAGNEKTYYSSVGLGYFLVDSTPPTGFAVTDEGFYTFSTTLSATWTSATDAESGISRYMYAIGTASDPTAVSGWKNTSSTTVTEPGLALQDEKTYYFTVIAYSGRGINLATNRSSDGILYIDRSAPEPVSIIRVEYDTTIANGFLDRFNNNMTNVTIRGEIGMSCVYSRYDIDYSEDPEYIDGACTTLSNSPNATCALNSSEGYNTYYIVCKDSEGNAQLSGENTLLIFLVDTTGPAISITNPDASEVMGGTAIFTANLTDPSNVSVARFIISNSSAAVSQGSLNLTSSWSLSWDTTKYPDGSHTYTIIANDTLGFSANTSVNFTIDNTIPPLDFIFPDTNNRFINSPQLTINISIQNFENATLNVTQSSGSLVYSSSNRSNSTRASFYWHDSVNISAWPDGRYTVSVYSVDETANSNIKSFDFYIDRTAPRFTAFSDSPDPVYNNETVHLNATWVNNWSQIANRYDIERVIISHNANGSWQNITVASDTVQFTAIIQASLVDNNETILWISMAQDFSGNWNTTMPLQVIRVQNRAPFLNKTIEDQVWAEDSPNFNISLDEHFLDPDKNIYHPGSDNLSYSYLVLPDGTSFYDSLQNATQTGYVGGTGANVRYVAGKFGNAALIEGPYTNPLSNPSFESALINWTTAGSPRLNNTNFTNTSYGNSSVKVNVNNYVKQTVPASGNTAYTLSMYIMSETSAKGRLHINWLDENGSIIESSLTCPGCRPTVNRSMVRYKASLTSPANTRYAEIIIDSNNNSYVWVDAIQFEQGSYATAFTGERQSTGLTYDSLDIGTSGTLEMWARPEWDGASQSYNVFFTLGSATLARANGLLRFSVGGNAISANISSWQEHSWHHIAVSWKPSNVSLYVDGVRASSGSISMPGSPPLYLGSDSAFANSADCLIDELIFFSYAKSASQIQGSSSQWVLAEPAINATIYANSSVRLIGSTADWYGKRTIQFFADDGHTKVPSNMVNLTVYDYDDATDTDGDGIPDINDTDDDNDNINDTFDTVTGNTSHITTSLSALSISACGSYNISSPSGSCPVEMRNGTDIIVQFRWNFSAGAKLNLANITLETQGSGSTGYTIVSGIDLTGIGTKNIIVNDRSGSNILCVKDARVSSVSEITSGCTGASEYIITCPGTAGSYSCAAVSNGYNVSGLVHCAIKQTDSYCGDGTCNSNEDSSSCSADCPAPRQSSSSGGGSPSKRTVVYKSIGFADQNAPAEAVINNPGIPVTRVTISLSGPAENIQLTVESHDSRPSTLPAITGIAYRYLTITPRNLDNTLITKAEIIFRVPESWFDANSIGTGGISLWHFETQWTRITANYLYKSGTDYYYSATVGSFSFFAIGSSTASARSTAASGTTASCYDGIRNQDEAGVDCGGPCTSCPRPIGASCYDGIRNQDEAGVDCGGVCAPCLAGSPGTTPGTGGSTAPQSCHDGIENQDEEGVDCGGVCVPCGPIPPTPQKAREMSFTWIFALIGITMTGGGAFLYKKTRPKDIHHHVNTLSNFVQEAVNKGTQREHIRSMLLNKGWPAMLIEHMLDRHIMASDELVSNSAGLFSNPAEVEQIRAFGDECSRLGKMVHIVATASNQEATVVPSNMDGTDAEKKAYQKNLEVARSRVRYLESLIPNHDESEAVVEENEGDQYRYYTLEVSQ